MTSEILAFPGDLGRASWLVLASLLLGLAFFSPGYLLNPDGRGPAMMGYTDEPLALAEWMLDAAFGHTPRREPPLPRHGPVEALVFLPFVALGRLFADAGIRHFIAGLQPVTTTALLGTVFFRWGAALVGPRRAALWTAGAVFSTMLWPYAFIGLETTQSLFVLLTGYLALGPCGLRPRLRIPLTGLCAGFALAAKASGPMLAPAIGFALVTACWRMHARHRVRAAWLAAVSAFAGTAPALATRWRGYELGQGAAGAFSFDPLSWVINLLGLLLSLNKGLIVYAPLVMLVLVGLRRALRWQLGLTVFAVLVLAGLAGGFAFFFFWGEETWGPRYLHSAVPGLLLVAAVGTARPWRRHRIAFASLASVGVIVSLLGCLFNYGVLFLTARLLTTVTTERLQGDPALNPVIFNLRLVAALWERHFHAESNVPYLWSASGHRWFPEQAAGSPPAEVDLRYVAVPQPEVIRIFSLPSRRRVLVLRSFYSCLLLGALAAAWVLCRYHMSDARARGSPGGSRSQCTVAGQRSAGAKSAYME